MPRSSVYPPNPREPHSTHPWTQALVLSHLYPSPCSMDRDGTMTIDWQEWRDHFLLHSLENVEDVLYFWKHSTVRWGAAVPAWWSGPLPQGMGGGAGSGL